MIFTIVRDQRTGGEYTDDAANKDKEEYGYFANEAADIEVEIRDGPYYKGTGEADDPDSADVTGGARVCDDVRYYPPLGGGAPQFDRFVFRAGQVIDLTDEELRQAEEQALEEKRAEAEPEYSPE
jgi:hypothetical protein